MTKEWTRYLDSLAVRAVTNEATSEVDDDEHLYNDRLQKLPSDVLDIIENSVAESDEPDFQEVANKWVLCNMPEGEFPTVSIYPTLARLADAIAKQEGKETAVWAMYGLPLQLTQGVSGPGGVTRFLLLPNQTAAVVGSKSSGEIISCEDLPDGIQLQDGGWLGDPSWVNAGNYFIDGHSPADNEDENPNIEI